MMMRVRVRGRCWLRRLRRGCGVRLRGLERGGGGGGIGGGGDEKGGGMGGGMAEAERKGRTQRRHGIRSGSKNAFRKV